MICIDCDTEMTGKPVCRATRSAVRCRVPVSSEWIEWSGIRCTAARRIRVMSRSRMIAPSILASSRSPVAVNGTSRLKPPVEMVSTVLSLPSTIRAPVRPRRIRSRPSRSAVPGAIDGQRRRAAGAPRRCGRPTTTSPQSCCVEARQSRGSTRWPGVSSSAEVRSSSGCARRRSPAAPGRSRTSGTSTTRMPVDLAGARRPRRWRRNARPGRRRLGSRAGPPRPAAAAGRGPDAARRPGRSRRSRRCRAGGAAT